MKRFNFRLDRVLRIRAHRLSEARVALACAQRAAASAERAARGGESALSSARISATEQLRRGLDGAHAQLLSDGVELLAAERTRLRTSAAEAERESAAALRGATAANSRLRGLELLRGRKLRDYLRERERREQRDLDDVAQRRHRVRAFGLVVAGVLLIGAAPLDVRAADSPRQEVELLLLEMRRNRAELERRENDVSERERAAAELEAEVDRRIEEFEALRSALELRLSHVEEGLGDQVGRLAKTYSSMAPESAARLLEKLNSDLSSTILRRIKPKKSAPILAAMSRTKARELSRMLAKPFHVSEAAR